MFNLMTNCCSWVSKVQEPIRNVNVLVVGLDQSGKTSSIRGMIKEAVPRGVEAGPPHSCVRHQLRVDNYVVTLVDVGGSEESRVQWGPLSGGAHGLVFVVDSSDKSRMKEVREVMADLLREPRVAGKPLLVLANKQDQMNALLGNELIEILSLEKLVNQSRSLCHIEACSALMELRRWSDRRTLKGLRWLLGAVSLDFPQLSRRVLQDGTPPGPRQQDEIPEEHRLKKKRQRKVDRRRSKTSDLGHVHGAKEKEKKIKGNEGKLQPVNGVLHQENKLKTKLTPKRKKKPIGVKEEVHEPKEEEEEEEEKEEEPDGEQQNSRHPDKTSRAVIPKKTEKTKVKEERLDEGAEGNIETRKKKKVSKVKRKNKITTEGTPDIGSQPVDLSATFDLYRKAILALKERQKP